MTATIRDDTRSMTTLSAGRPPGGRKGRPGGRIVANLFLAALIIYFLIPIWWLFVASTKDVGGLFNGTSGALWFDKTFALFTNLGDLFTYNDGIYLQWLGNSLLYAV